MPVNPEILYSLQKVEPIFPEEGGQRPLAFMPNQTIARGTVLGQVSAANANEVQTIDFAPIGGSGNAPAAGTFTLSITGIDGGTFTTAALAWNIANADLKTAIEALLDAAGYTGATVVVAGGPAPADVTVTFGGTAANWDMPLLVATSSLLDVGARATTLTVVETTPGNRIGLWGPYSDVAADGRDVARAIAAYSFRTDNVGRVVFAGAGESPEYGTYHLTAPAWFKGRFRTTDLTGLDANGIADLGRLESGTLADGILALI